MNIVVLSGGLSTERSVSLTTGAKVQNALVANGHHAILADVFMGYKLSGSIEEEFLKATKLLISLVLILFIKFMI